jgi:hypothetical protein
MNAAALERELLGDLAVSPDLWDNLTYLCDACNGRFAGTDDERRAGNFILARFHDYGLANVSVEPFEMRGWGAEAILHCCRMDPSAACLALPAPIRDIRPWWWIPDPSRGGFRASGNSVAGKIVLAIGRTWAVKILTAMEAGAVGSSLAMHNRMLAPATSSTGSARCRDGLRARCTDQTPDGKGGHAPSPAQGMTVTARNIVARSRDGFEPGWTWPAGTGRPRVALGRMITTSVAALMEAARLLPLRRNKAGIRFV